MKQPPLLNERCCHPLLKGEIWLKIKKLISVLLCVVLMCSCLSILSAGVSIESEKAYKPLDLVIVMDISGSMNDSDPGKSALQAVKMLVNMMIS